MQFCAIASIKSTWKQIPRLKFWGLEQTSRTGQQEGWEKRWKRNIFLRGEFWRTNSPFLTYFVFSWPLFWLITSILDGPQGGIDKGDPIGAYFKFSLWFLAIFFGFCPIFCIFVAVLWHFWPFCMFFRHIFLNSKLVLARGSNWWIILVI